MGTELRTLGSCCPGVVPGRRDSGVRSVHGGPQLGVLPCAAVDCSRRCLGQQQTQLRCVCPAASRRVRTREPCFLWGWRSRSTTAACGFSLLGQLSHASFFSRPLSGQHRGQGPCTRRSQEEEPWRSASSPGSGSHSRVTPLSAPPPSVHCSRTLLSMGDWMARHCAEGTPLAAPARNGTQRVRICPSAPRGVRSCLLESDAPARPPVLAAV